MQQWKDSNVSHEAVLQELLLQEDPQRVGHPPPCGVSSGGAAVAQGVRMSRGGSTPQRLQTASYHSHEQLQETIKSAGAPPTAHKSTSGFSRRQPSSPAVHQQIRTSTHHHIYSRSKTLWYKWHGVVGHRGVAATWEKRPDATRARGRTRASSRGLAQRSAGLSVE